MVLAGDGDLLVERVELQDGRRQRRSRVEHLRLQLASQDPRGLFQRLFPDVVIPDMKRLIKTETTPDRFLPGESPVLLVVLGRFHVHPRIPLLDQLREPLDRPLEEPGGDERFQRLALDIRLFVDDVRVDLAASATQSSREFRYVSGGV